jgi:hypothetical protein
MFTDREPAALPSDSANGQGCALSSDSNYTVHGNKKWTPGFLATLN